MFITKVAMFAEAPNVVPDRATTWYFVRDTDQRIKDNFDKVPNCAKVMAISAIELMSDKKKLDDIKAEFNEMKKKYKTPSWYDGPAMKME